MRAFLIDYTTIVLDDRHAHLPGVEYYEVEVDGRPVRFAQHANAVLPAMLEDLVGHSSTQSVGGLRPSRNLSSSGCSCCLCRSGSRSQQLSTLSITSTAALTSGCTLSAWLVTTGHAVGSAPNTSHGEPGRLILPPGLVVGL